MKFTTETAALSAALARVMPIVDRSVSIPILTHLLVRADSAGQVELQSSNFDMHAVAYLPADVTEAGETTIPAAKINDIARNLALGSQVGFSLEGERAIVKSGRSRFALPLLAVAGFPTLAPVAATEWEADAETLGDALKRTVWAAGKDEGRAFLHGVRLTLTDTEAHAVATDGKRVAFVRVPADAGPLTGLTIPSRMVAETIKLLDGAGETVRVCLAPGRVTVRDDHGSLSSKTIDLDYPDYVRFVRKEAPHAIKVGREALAAMLRRVAAIVDKEEDYRMVRLSAHDGLLAVTSKSMDTDGADEIEAEIDGPDVEVRIAADSLVKALANVKGETAVIGYTDASEPLVITGSDDPMTVVNVVTARG